MSIEKGIFKRTELLVGEKAFKSISECKVIIFGVGGVGSWCAESLVRSGIRKITLVDSDRVCVTNINRQLMATTETIGQVKVEALKRIIWPTPKQTLNNTIVVIVTVVVVGVVVWLLDFLFSSGLDFALNTLPTLLG